MQYRKEHPLPFIFVCLVHNVYLAQVPDPQLVGLDVGRMAITSDHSANEVCEFVTE